MTQSYILRLFEPSTAEYEAIVHVYNQANPHAHGSAATWRHWDQHRDTARKFTRHVVERGGQIGGYGFSVRTDPAANKFRFSINLLPEWQTAELIDHVYTYLMEYCLEMEPAALICGTREDEPEKIAWLKGEGFRKVMRYPRSTLNVTEFDLSSFKELTTKVADQGMKIISLESLAIRDPAWKKKVYDLEMLLSRDVPMPTEFSPLPFEKYAQREFDDPDFMPGLWLIALDGDAYVGMTSLFKTGKGVEVLETGLTGVRRDYRRRGLAMTLKCQAIEIARGLGARLIQTSNEENNPMYQLNLQLGFQAQPADVDWKKAIGRDGLG
ncbi:MAG TPA: GNAT family N-acetyltransferase [Anaerolineae bacterium]|jgi:GNAT superfamily N-acetyltransferase|nr:GNAT family N-acetyltransferase [Anaerolineae bacterium]